MNINIYFLIAILLSRILATCPETFYPRAIGSFIGNTELTCSDIDLYLNPEYILMGGYSEASDLVYNKGAAILMMKDIDSNMVWAKEFYYKNYGTRRVNQCYFRDVNTTGKVIASTIPDNSIIVLDKDTGNLYRHLTLYTTFSLVTDFTIARETIINIDDILMSFVKDAQILKLVILQYENYNLYNVHDNGQNFVVKSLIRQLNQPTSDIYVMAGMLVTSQYSRAIIASLSYTNSLNPTITNIAEGEKFFSSPFYTFTALDSSIINSLWIHTACYQKSTSPSTWGNNEPLGIFAYSPT